MAAVTALIQADLLVYQAASATPVVSTAVESTGIGGLLQSLVPTHGDVNCTAVQMALSTVTTTVGTTAFLLVASRMIKVCVHQVIVSDI